MNKKFVLTVLLILFIVLGVKFYSEKDKGSIEFNYVFKDTQIYSNNIIIEEIDNNMYYLHRENGNLMKIDQDNNIIQLLDYKVTNFYIDENNLFVVLANDQAADEDNSRVIDVYQLDNMQKKDTFNLEVPDKSSGSDLYYLTSNEKYNANVDNRNDNIGLGKFIYTNEGASKELINYPIIQFSVNETINYYILYDEFGGRLISEKSLPLIIENDIKMSDYTNNITIDDNVEYFKIVEGGLYYYKIDNNKFIPGKTSYDDQNGFLYYYDQLTQKKEKYSEFCIRGFSVGKDGIYISLNADDNKGSDMNIESGLYKLDDKNNIELIIKGDVSEIQIDNDTIIVEIRETDEHNEIKIKTSLIDEDKIIEIE